MNASAVSAAIGRRAAARRLCRGRSVLSFAADAVLFGIVLLAAGFVLAEPLVAPGDPALRHDLQRLNDEGTINIPLTTWPLSWEDIDRHIVAVESRDLRPSVLSAYLRVKEKARRHTDADYYVSAAVAENPRIIRTFENTPREDGELSAGFSWSGDRLALNLNATGVLNPLDDQEVRPDGSYLGLRLGNWLFSAGWQERWWGPGRDGSLILSSNARPAPGIAVQRVDTAAFESRWLNWIGPWSLTAFMDRLDDERIVEDALLFGLRISFKPHESLEIGLSRTAQWCGEQRPCDVDAFVDLVFGKDNKGVNVDPAAEPGNQLAGLDMRWRLPRNIPVALYMQWIGEDTRQGGPEIGSWLRQAGVESWWTVLGLEQRTHFEISDTTCREGGFGFAEAKPDCAYEHGIYRTGYRYEGRVLGHALDGDGRAYSLGSTLLEQEGHSWNLALRYMELNRAGGSGTGHTLAQAPQDVTDLQLSHERLTGYGRFRVGLGVTRVSDDVGGSTATDVTGFVQWATE